MLRLVLMGELRLQQQFLVSVEAPELDARQDLFPDADPTLALLPQDISIPSLALLVDRAKATGTNIVTCAVTSGLADEVKVYARFAEICGFRIHDAPLSTLQPICAPGHWSSALEAGVIPVRQQSGTIATLFAPHLAELHHLLVARERFKITAPRIIITTRRHYQAYIRSQFAQAWLKSRIDHLHDIEPDASARDMILMRRTTLAILAIPVLLYLALAIPSSSPFAMGLFGMLFGLWSLTRLLACASSKSRHDDHVLDDAELPLYSILVPLYKEAAIVYQLVEALQHLDYPAEKLDIILILETDDIETRSALVNLGLSSRFSIVPIPAFGPRTKPKALAAALPFAKGQLIVVYDAEDRPHPLQLREAAARFKAGGMRLGCLQAPLVITGFSDSLIAKLFAIEYAGLFRTLLPAMARWRWPVPLGGTSNHFRKTALSNVGGWDPFNVTEDADLGIRLARNGWKVDVLDHPTYEQAVDTPLAWLRQRRRWFKGWMQTLGVCSRDPVTTFRQLGWNGSLGLLATLCAATFVALVHPLFIGMMLTDLLRQDVPLHALTIALMALVGYATSMAITLVNLSPQERLTLTPQLLLIPVYWLALSLAAWLAILDLAYRPFHWDKTDHVPVKDEPPIPPPSCRMPPAQPAPHNI